MFRPRVQPKATEHINERSEMVTCTLKMEQNNNHNEIIQMKDEVHQPRKPRSGISCNVHRVKSEMFIEENDVSNLECKSESTKITGKDLAIRLPMQDTDTTCDDHARYFRDKKTQEAISRGDLKEGIYRGMNARRKYIKVDARVENSKKITGSLGANRASEFQRVTTYIDLHGIGICKDYKETGYCTFGDSCIYLHDRSDYKTGDQIDRDWTTRCSDKKTTELMKDNHNHVLSDISCVYCHDKEDGELMKPLCGHVYCSRCFIAQAQKRCTYCGTKTNGQAVTLNRNRRKSSDYNESIFGSDPCEVNWEIDVRKGKSGVQKTDNVVYGISE